MPKFSVGELCLVLGACPQLQAKFGSSIRCEVIRVPASFNRDVTRPSWSGWYLPAGSYEVRLPDGSSGGTEEEFMRKLPPDDTRDALPRWCRNLFDIDVDQPDRARKPVNNVK